MSVGFDSNLFYGSQQGADRLHDAPEGSVEPRLSIDTEEPGTWDLSADAAVRWRQYFSDEEVVRNQSGLSARLDGSAWWNSEGAASLKLSNQFTRTNETPSTPSGNTINRIFNRAGVMGGLHPGGRILETYASYDFSIYRHSRFEDLDRVTHHFGWNAHWSFLPQTALTAEVDYRLIRYDQDFRGEAAGVSPDGQLTNVDSDPLRVMGGLRGLITPRISLHLRGGYGWARYAQGATFSGPLVRVEASYQFGNVDFDNRLRLGYDRDFKDSTIGNFYTAHRALAGYEQGFVDNRLRLDLEVEAQIRDYSELGVTEATTEDHQFEFPEDLSDLVLGVSARTTYDIRDGWSVGARYGFRSNFTEDRILIGGTSEDVVRDFQRHQVLLTTELTY